MSDIHSETSFVAPKNSTPNAVSGPLGDSAACFGLDDFRGCSPEEQHARLARLFEYRQAALRHMIAARIDSRLARRVDVSDILQESFLTVVRRFDDYLAHEEYATRCPPALWLRDIVLQTLCDTYRRHFGTQKRDARIELFPFNAPSPRNTAAEDLSVGLLVDYFAADQTSPSEAMMRQETRDQIAEALRKLSPIDREILILRHFEQLENTEIAQMLQITPAAASARYVRAIVRIQQWLQKDNAESP
ncbi:MAG: sigma-70 family RNA polymerase sigma factor [Thermoguttaceae bacterium]|nr:sigma-70 family RNA polymerase sigma factor [Thermoguttaceae bacterium]